MYVCVCVCAIRWSCGRAMCGYDAARKGEARSRDAVQRQRPAGRLLVCTVYVLHNITDCILARPAPAKTLGLKELGQIVDGILRTRDG